MFVDLTAEKQVSTWLGVRWRALRVEGWVERGVETARQGGRGGFGIGGVSVFIA